MASHSRGGKVNIEDWAEFSGDPLFVEEFQKIHNNPDIPEADDVQGDSLGDTYLNMELSLPRDGNRDNQFAKVTKRLRDADGIPIGTAADNPMLDTRLYEVEFLDGYRASVSANELAINLFSQVDEEGNRFVLFDEIVDHRTDGNQISEENAFITSSNGGRRRKETTKGWELLLKWKDGSTSWETLKDVKECFPSQVTDYAQMAGIVDCPAFAWWCPHVIRKRERIISRMKSKYWKRTHKFGIKIPKSIKQALQFDSENGNTLWWDAISMEMKNVMIAFEEFDGEEDELPPEYQFIKCHMIFDVKMGENFRRKARMVAGGHMTETPSSITYSSVVSRDSVRIALLYAALNDLKVFACDIQNAYLTAKCREKIWCRAGPEFGDKQGKIMIIVRALYGLKSSGAAFRSLLAEKIYEDGFRPSKADGDVWLRPAVKANGKKYYEYILTYVDDVLGISENPKMLECIGVHFKLKNDSIEEPETYLGANISKMVNCEGTECWCMGADDYCSAAVATVEDYLKEKGLRLPSKCPTPMNHGYRPEN